ncbi:MAG: HlyC/CorC family transporter [Chromatiales bacterium]|nr:HlyC/CorC family transporter [Chromatiales bacterium]
MTELSLTTLGILLGVLLLLSAFFSGSETALMTLNRYRLRHLAQAGHRGARFAQRLLDRPDRLIGLILLGNNFVNILASSIATLMALRIGGEEAIALATGLLTFVVLIYAEVTPKTVAALHPERIAFPAAMIYVPLLALMYPLVWVINLFANTQLRLIGVHMDHAGAETLSREELRTIVNEAGAMIPRRHQKMLVSVLDLEKLTVNDIMVPRGDIEAIDLSAEPTAVMEQLRNLPYSRVPVYEGSFDHVLGVLVARSLVGVAFDGSFDVANVRALLHEPYFIPDGTPLYQQMQNFQREKRRSALVVNEYGDVIGLVTMQDLLAEIVGEFASDPSSLEQEVHRQSDGSFIVDASAFVRELNRLMHWELPTDGPKTLSGLIVEYLEHIPEAGTSLRLAGYPIEIVQTKDNMIKTVRISPEQRRIEE